MLLFIPLFLENAITQHIPFLCWKYIIFCNYLFSFCQIRNKLMKILSLFENSETFPVNIALEGKRQERLLVCLKPAWALNKLQTGLGYGVRASPWQIKEQANKLMHKYVNKVIKLVTLNYSFCTSVFVSTDCLDLFF